MGKIKFWGKTSWGGLKPPFQQKTPACEIRPNKKKN